MKTAAVIVSIIVALALQATLSGMLIGSTIAVNLVLVAVVYLALAYGAVTGLLGIVAFFIVEQGPGTLQRRRMGQSSLSKRRF